MQTITLKTMQLAVILMLVIALFGTSSVFAASLPASVCTGSGTVTCDLYAMTGTATLFGSTTVNIWGYSASSTLGTATLPGPALIVNQGDTVTVNLHNVNIPESTALNLQGQSMIPDTTGVTAGNSKTYTFTASNPGTFIYESGLTGGTQHQVAMGMYGAFVVKPADGTAYGSTSTAFNEETVLVLSEIDPVLNTILPAPPNASPATFDMRKYAPKYFLVNGKAYMSGFTGDIPVTAGNIVLLRYVNAGMQSHAMATLGIAQKVIATDGFAFGHPHSMVAETIATGQTLDTLVTIPASVANGTKYPLYDANLMLRNANASNMGGMLTFLTVGTIAPPVDTGPFVTSIGLSPSSTNGASAVTVNATISDVGTLTINNITSAEFYIDSTAGSANAMSGTFGSPTVSVTGTIPAATMAILASGNHTIYVRGRDSANNWSSFLSVALNLDKTGPATSGLSLTPNPSSGAVSIALAATGNDTSTGNSNVTAAEYWVDGSATHIAMTASGAASPTRNFTTTISAGLSQGTHVVSVRSQDSFGNWGAVSTINLQVADTVAPTTSGVSASPNPNNGSTPYNTSVPAVRVFASFSDVSSGGSNIAAAEGFLDAIGTTGTGFAFIATDGVFNNPSETGYADIPVAVIGALSQGNHTIYVHAKDAAGNWGANSTVVLVIDKTPPTVVSINRVGASPTNVTSVQFLVTFSESVNGSAASNFTLTTTGSFSVAPSITSVSTGPANTRTVTVNTGSNSGTGTHTIRLDMTSATGVADLAGNALIGLPFNTGQTYSVDKLAPTFASVTINPTSITAGTASITMAVNGSADTGGSGLSNAGEYWFDTASITPGTGIAFTGTSGISVATGALTAGSHTLLVRIRDNAGNWSTVHTASLTVTVSLTNPTVTKAFAGAVRGGNGTTAQRTTTLTITLSNSNAVALTGATLTDNLPQPASGTFTVVSSLTTCGGTTSTANTNRRLLLTGGTIPANSSCTVTATVRLSNTATVGPYTLTNTILVGGVTTTNAGNNLLPASAVLTVNP